MPIPYDDQDLFRWFDEVTLGRSEQCIGGVRNLQRHGDLLLADVQGSARHPYGVEIDLGASTRTPRSRLQGDCSCPVGRNCKHVAAALVVYLLDDSIEVAVGPPAGEDDEDDTASALNGPPRPELLAELSRWQSRRSLPAKPRRNGVIFDLSTSGHRPYVVMRKVDYRPNGTLSIGKWVDITAEMLLNPPGYLAPSDISVIAQLWAERHAKTAGPRIDINATLQLIIDSGHGWVSGQRHERVPARRGPARRGTLGWQIEEIEDIPLSKPSLHVEGDAEGLVMGSAAGYLDPITGEVGPLLLDVKTEDADVFLTLPHLMPSEAPVVAQMLRQMDPALPRPSAPDALPTLQIKAMTPVLRLHSLEFRPAWLHRRDDSHWADFATVAFEYDEHVRFLDNPSVFVHDANGDLALLPRDPAEEARREHELRGFNLHRDTAPRVALQDAGPHFVLRSYNWTRLLLQDVPQLEALGWKVEVDDDFRHRITLIEDIDLDIQPSASGDGWFDLGLDIQVDGRTVPLAPLLHKVLQTDPRWLRGQIDAIGDDENVMLSPGGNTHLAIKAARLKPVIALLADLFSQRDAPLRVSARDRGRLRALQDNARLQFKGSQDTRALVQRLLQTPALEEIAPPAGLAASLRPYQLQGLAWLQYLRQQDLGGVLADDMGLGKTLQTLAHILLEKEQGRLQQPALVVVPTSLLHNWTSEAARFTPDLRVLALHGADRAAHFDRIGEHDLVLTTYPLVWRDEEALLAHDYHLLILDEAQQVKNAKSKAAIALRTLHARHRLCLTGTPLENHLGELWAQFDFLLPGLLGNEKQFNQHWRHPIERGSDPQRAHLLAQRLRPFMLRRRKDQVAAELPPKTEITRTVALEGAQRDLYETVRASMEAKVREAVAAQGLGRSHILVLDALLKLRQVCCDPRLLPGETGKRSAPSAKLDLLRDMLPEMVEEGRRILLFSQFTSMLALIAQALDEMGLAHVQLTGDTQDRATPVQRFMAGEVPIFLISLKAGGVGLNLTAADTVIHFDPWWNPAAERQATDRAHRIGQEQPVFVYRLIAAGSIEERIAELQERKAALADSILEGGNASGPRFNDEDLEALLAPLPGVVPKGKRGRSAK
ncbi:DEAD/DEAH box helicase [Stenotrophomonas cyclobalanopsidis]|uniref:DEAD/DEAH box helicase n=1 Tax=Stenotrophomonas cyclobalanopsidis TaxID=2771362 RepID=A0ABQ6SVR6_9GAMM|nr:DEAD/DEAH box helicase [Stenotrophomonas cyclobalanopsidis]KAA8992415.1 DEAD/DEAH box helicase [Stenotrophomonas cyclobalanopsidis]